MEKIILILLGLAMILLSSPNIRQPIMVRLFNEGIVTPKVIEPKEGEIIRNAGPNVSLFVIGIIFIIIGIIL